MLIKLLNNKIVKLNLKKFQRKKSVSECKSKFQFEVGKLLSSVFPNDIILEEIRIPKENFVFDFFVPSAKIMIECQGIQHDKFTPFFHGDIHNFNLHKDRDLRKKEFCKINNITLIEIKQNEWKQSKDRSVFIKY